MPNVEPQEPIVPIETPEPAASKEADESIDRDSLQIVQAISKSQAMIEFELDGTIITANEYFLSVVGYGLNEIQGKHHSMFVDPSFAASAEYKEFWATLGRGEFQAAEYKRIGKGGKEVWIQANYNPIFNHDGKPFKVVKFATDVTAEKLKSADAAGQIEAIGKAQAVIEFNLDGTIITAKENFLVTLGYGLEEIQGKHHSMFVEPALAESAEYKEFWAKLGRGEYEAAEYKRIGKGGKEIWIQASYNPINDLNGKPFKVVKFATDITKQVEEAKTNAESARLVQMVDDMPINVMTCDPKTLEITYLNSTSIKTLKTLEHLLPVKAEDMLGQCIDIFHKDPSHQRRLLADPKNPPHQAIIQVGEESLNLLVTAIMDKDGGCLGPMLSWSVVTEQLKADAESARLLQMVETMPINVMTCDPESLEITYLNKTSIETLATLEHLLPVKASEMLSQCIDIFHKDPSHQRRLLADPKNLPHKAIIQVGEESLDLLVSAIMDKDGGYLGPMLSWSVVTEQLKADAESARLLQMLDVMPVNVMMLDKDSFEISYINKASIETLRPLQSLLPVPVDKLLGQCVDVFHKDPSHQRRLLSDPNNLPHQANIELGDEILDLQVNAIMDKDGGYIGPMLSWSVVTEAVAKERETAKLMQMLDVMPVNVMMLDKDSFEISYINKTSIETLRPLQSLLPVPVDKLQGQCVDVFHKDPSHQRRLLSDPNNLPHRAKIALGDETLDLQVNAIMDTDGGNIGPMLS